MDYLSLLAFRGVCGAGGCWLLTFMTLIMGEAGRLPASYLDAPLNANGRDENSPVHYNFAINKVYEIAHHLKGLTATNGISAENRDLLLKIFLRSGTIMRARVEANATIIADQNNWSVLPYLYLSGSSEDDQNLLKEESARIFLLCEYMALFLQRRILAIYLNFAVHKKGQPFTLDEMADSHHFCRARVIGNPGHPLHRLGVVAAFYPIGPLDDKRSVGHYFVCHARSEADRASARRRR